MGGSTPFPAPGRELPAFGARWRAGAIVGGIVLAAILRFGFFALEPPGRDQGVFSNLADGVLRGKLLYRDLWENKPPAVVWLYSAAIGLLGRDYTAIHALQAVFVVLTALAIAWLIRRTTGCIPAAVSAALLYVVHAGGLAFGGFWGTAQAEVFMDLPIAAALMLLLSGRRAAGRRAWLAAGMAGLCVGWTVLLKYSAAPLFSLGVLAWWGVGSRPERIRRLAVFAAGCALPGMALVTWTMAAGSWEDFLRATVMFNAAYRAATAPSQRTILERVFYSVPLLLALYVPAVLGLASARLPRRREEVDVRDLAAAAAWLWALSLAQVFWQGKFWIYHYHVILLPLAVLAGVGIAVALGWARRTAPRVPAWPAVAVFLMALSLPYGARLVSYERHHGIAARWLGRVTAKQMEASYTWGAPDYEFAQTKAVARAIAKEVPPGERIFVWGFEPYVYFLSGREPASRFQYDLPLMPQYTSLRPVFAEQLMEDLRRHPPARLLVVANDANDVEALDSVHQLLAWPELRAWVDAYYEPSWRLGDFLCFARREAERAR